MFKSPNSCEGEEQTQFKKKGEIGTRRDDDRVGMINWKKLRGRKEREAVQIHVSSNHSKKKVSSTASHGRESVTPRNEGFPGARLRA